jgi:hypothetical protein
VEDNSFAGYDDVGPSHYIRGTNFGFTLPATAIMRGFKLEMYGYASYQSYYDNSVRLRVDTSYVGTDKAADTWVAGSSSTRHTYGGATDLWGISPAPTGAQVDSANFGAGFSSFAATGGGNFLIDSMRITVYYDAGAQLSESDVPPVVPWNMIYAVPEVSIYTPFSTYSNFIGLDLRLGSNGSMGSWRLDVSDDIGLEYNKVIKNLPIWFHLKQGPFERLLLGRIETPERIEAPSADGNILRLSGRGWGSFLLERNKPADFSAWTIYDILTDPVNGLASAISEVVFGDYIQSPGAGTITTSAKKRSVGDVLDELMIRAGTANLPWTYWVCHGEHPGESVRPNLHFRPKNYYPAPIVVCEGDTLSLDRLSTLQFLQNAAEVEYGSGGSTVTRNDTNSQALWHIFYKYVYAPFLSAAADANDWGDKILNQTVNPLNAITFTVPFTLALMPNYTVGYYARTFQKTYEISTVQFRIRPPRLCHTKVTAATTIL